MDGIGGDVVVAVGSWHVTGARGMSRGEQGGVGQLLGRHLEQWGWQGLSLEQQTHSGECIHTWSCNTVCCTVDSRQELSRGWVAISGVVVAIWVLDAAVVIISWEVAAGIVIVVGCDMAVAISTQE